VDFAQEGFRVRADEECLRRIFHNLIQNALLHGGGDIVIRQEKDSLLFENMVSETSRPDPEHLFDRFYQGSPARGEGGAGLGLSIVRELMEQMGGRVSARIDGDILRIMLMFSPGPDSRAIPHEGDAPGGGHIGRYR
jgi:signal transduction histidine kinase